MSPTYTMSAHLCKQIYKSFQTRQTSPDPLSSPATNAATITPATTYMSSDSSAHGPASPPSSSSWRWGGR
ncbi:hypothetical protein GGS23DRAFT_598664 [Durotheca rogersii]|uniref:uncharacterized protein n=1 Tax=Durotheca rogersii TaxID=419775 RepID=UPI00221F5118|nr:uncharacterized protein GGS23DRAFT_598664 [Durotheca rogersii]KAI5861135.1 hypothetical protein GGS23DRAFT_598664 [Durotheca rogersii]